jgi:drug/metabolite transporter (DMT)-like permease
MIGIALLLVLIIFELIADIFAKEWSLSGSLPKASVAFIAYFLANTAWLFAMRKGITLSRGAIIFSVASAILALIVGVLIYKEPTSKYQIVGAIFGIVALALLA